MASSSIVTAAIAAVALPILYIYRLNQLWKCIPQEALEISPHRWTEDEIKKTYEKVCKKPIDFRKILPPKLERRYIVVGGAGLVGGDIVLHLLLRGQPPSSIRIVDIAPPKRADLLQGAAAQVDFAAADISDPASVEAAFSKPWPSSVEALPLTVHHTAAVIRPAERSPLVWERTRPVNVDGTRHSMDAARRAGANVFIFTSSISVGLLPCTFFVAPWASRPRRWFQVLDESDYDVALRPKEDFFANYAYSKGLAERLVGAANEPGFRTGCVRPGNGIYGMPKDLVYTDFLAKTDTAVTMCANTIQNAVSSRNVSLAHMCFEAALLSGGEGGAAPACAGRPFVVSDSGPPPSWQDFFLAARVASRTPVAKVVELPAAPLFLLAHAVEAWSLLLARFPFLTRAPFGLREPAGDMRHLQPAIFTPQAFVICADGKARRSVAEGGIGYKGAISTLEGTCELLREWNRTHAGAGAGDGGSGGKGGSVLEADLVHFGTAA